jgi:hypothetical protein
MISKSEAETPQENEENSTHPLARFVTEEAIALLLNIPASEINEIRCWRHMILVVAEHMVRFVSYADLPPILEVEPPTNEEFTTWRKRWKRSDTKQAPDFWKDFYAEKFRLAGSRERLYCWGRLVGRIKFAISNEWLESLRKIFKEVRVVVVSW